MEINKRNRTDLKSYFVKNSIPTESNFADLIDGMLNQKDDGIVKLPDNPLSIQASGDNASLQKVINFYRSFADANPAWMLNLNPRSDPNKPETAKAGFSISDGQGNSRLYIDPNSGNVGIGTIDPSMPGITRSLAVGRDAGGIYGIIQREVGPWRMSLVTEGQERLSIKDNGNVGIGVPDPQANLDVQGDLKLTGALNFGAQTRQMINLWNANYGIGIQNGTQYFRTDKNFAWYKGGSHNNTELNPGQGGIIQMLIKDGNVGIGTTDPTATLQFGDVVANSNLVISRKAASSHAPGNVPSSLALLIVDGAEAGVRIINERNKANTFNNQYIRFDTHEGGITVGERMRIAPNGNVGIGVDDPQFKLDVKGDAKIAGYIIGKNPFDRNFRDNEGTLLSDSARAKDILTGRPDGTFIIGGPTPNYPYHFFFYWKAGGVFYRTWIPFDPTRVEKF